MERKILSRREFLKYGAAGTLAVVGSPFIRFSEAAASPELELYQHPQLGGRADLAEEMPLSRKLGASRVRISCTHEEITNPLSNFRLALAAAKENNLTPMVVYAPAELPSDVMVTEEISTLAPLLNGGTIEVLNEPDDSGNEKERWKDKDMKTAAQLIKYVHAAIPQTYPNTKLVIGALKNIQNNLPILIACMQTEGLNPADFSYAVHGYQTAEEVISKISQTKDVLVQNGVINPDIIVSEVGANARYKDFNKSRILVVEDLVNAALNNGARLAFIHETKGEGRKKLGDPESEWSLTETEIQEYYKDWVVPRTNHQQPVNQQLIPLQENLNEQPAYPLIILIFALLVLAKKAFRRET